MNSLVECINRRGLLSQINIMHHQDKTLATCRVTLGKHGTTGQVRIREQADLKLTAATH